MEQNDITLDQIIEQSFDFSDYSEQEKQDLITETSGMIMESALLRVLGDAGEEMQEKFNTFIETEPKEEEMTAFIAEHFPNFGEVIIDEIKVFKEMTAGDSENSAE